MAERDNGLRRVSRLTRLLGLTALALIGALTGYVAQAKPGRSTTPARHIEATPPPRVHSEEAADSSEEAGSTLTPPSEPPLPATESPQVVTGGS